MVDKFLSDVHIYTENRRLQGGDIISQEQCLVVSRFEFDYILAKEDNINVDEFPKTLQDEDGDLILTRKLESKNEVINIHHTMATPLVLVGLQVWRGALLLADFLLCSGEDVLKDQVVLELGAGTGLCSLVSALFARHVFATDTGNDVLAICHKNCTQNGHIAICTGQMAQIDTRQLDWTQPTVFCTTVNTSWDWQPEDKELLLRCTVLLAADIVYDNDLTDAFLSTIDRISKTLPVARLYLALEKRLNFTLDDLEVACPAYTYFFHQLEHCEFVTRYQSLPTVFHQAFQYERVPQLELWEISLKNEDPVHFSNQ